MHLPFSHCAKSVETVNFRAILGAGFTKPLRKTSVLVVEAFSGKKRGATRNAISLLAIGSCRASLPPFLRPHFDQRRWERRTVISARAQGLCGSAGEEGRPPQPLPSLAGVPCQSPPYLNNHSSNGATSAEFLVKEGLGCVRFHAIALPLQNSTSFFQESLTDDWETTQGSHY